jgi:hypothetical protein
LPLPFSAARWRIQTKAALDRALVRDPGDLDIAAESTRNEYTCCRDWRPGRPLASAGRGG